MAHFNHEDAWPMQAASAAIPAYVPVYLVADEKVAKCASVNQLPIGLTIATTASPLDSTAVVTDGKAKAIANASLGAGALVGVAASTNAGLTPLAAAGVGSAGPGSVGIVYAIGVAVQAAAAGDIFTVLVDPQQVI